MEEENQLLTGNIWKQVLLFALPIAATSILQQIFNSTDTAVVGRFASSQALAAVGSTAPVANLCITILTGLAVGANVRIAYSIGAGDQETVRKGVSTAMIIAVISGVLLTVLGEIFTRPLLEIMNTPEDVIELAIQYLRIYFLGIVFLMIYNFEAAILRASGDSKKPLYCLLFSGVLNLGFNLLFVIVFRMGVRGVALGTLIADAVNAILLLYFLIKGNSLVRLDLKELHYDHNTGKRILAIGIPAALQGMMFNIANIIVQTGLNGLGSDVVAASTIGLNAEIFVYYMLSAFGQAAVTFNGQNLGAGNIRRCRQSTRVSLILGIIFVAILSGAFMIFAKPFAGIFSTDDMIISVAALRIRIILSCEIINVTEEILSGALRGLGHSTSPAVLSGIFICGTRILWVLFVFPMHHTFAWLLYVYPISWIINTIAILTAYFYVIKKLNKSYQG